MDDAFLRLGYPPDPDDAFLFWALSSRKIVPEGLTFLEVQKDLETLNEWAGEGRLEVTALSAHAYALVAGRYALLSAGAAFGEGTGPLVVAREGRDLAGLAGARIAVPGRLTTAALVLRLALEKFRLVPFPAERVAGAVRSGEVEAGVLLHEAGSAPEGLVRVEDLGAWWKAKTALPLPLGVNAVRKDVGKRVMKRVDKALRESLAYALAHPPEALAHAAKVARSFPREAVESLVARSVRPETLLDREEERKGLELLFRRGHEAGLLPPPAPLEIVT